MNIRIALAVFGASTALILASMFAFTSYTPNFWLDAFQVAILLTILFKLSVK